MPHAYSIAAFLVTVAYVPWFADAGNAPRWVLLSVLVPLAWRLRLWALPHTLAAVFFGFAALSLLWTPVAIEGVQPLWQFALLWALFCIGAEQDSMEPVFVGAAWGMALSGVAALFQAEPTGLFLNKNFMAEAAALVGAGLLAYRRYQLLPLILPAVLLPNARGALLALCVVVAMERGSRWIAAGLALLFTAVVMWWPHGASLGERWVIWSHTANHLTWFGHGLGSFYIDFPGFQEDGFARRFDHAHNDLLELVYELGVGTLPLLALWLVAMVQAQPLRLVLIAAAVEGCFGFPLFLPVTGALAAMAAGHLCGVWARVFHAEHVGEHRVRDRARQSGLRRRETASAPRGGHLPAQPWI